MRHERVLATIFKRELEVYHIQNYNDCVSIAKEYGFTGMFAYLSEELLAKEDYDSLADFIYDCWIHT